MDSASTPRGDDLQVRPQALGSHELDAHLGALVVSPRKVRAVAVHRLAVVEAQGLLPLLQPGGRHPGDGQGGVRPQHQEPALVVGALVHLLLGDGRPREVEHVEKLQPGGEHFVVAPQGEDLGEPAPGLPLGGALLKEDVPGALGRELAVCPHSFVPFSQTAAGPGPTGPPRRFSMLL